MSETNNLIPLSELQLQEQLETITDFLSAVHPSLLSKDGYKPCIEIRPINRGEEKNYMLSRSLNIWDLSNRTIERIKTFLERHNGKPTCIFYSVFSFDNTMESVTTTGKKAKNGKITKTSALGTDEIALDFDNISFDEYVNLVQQFEAMELYAIWVFSGHGYQAHILLDETLTDKDVLRRIVYKFRSKGFNCDPSCVDPARIMRLPGTFNCKCIADSSYDELEPPHVFVAQQSATRYSLERVLQELDKLPTMSADDEEIYNSFANAKPKKASKKAAASSSVSQDASDEEELVEVTRIEYPFLANFDLPEAVTKILAFTPRGYRNKALGFMVGFFKSHYRLGEHAMRETLSVWSQEACDPAYNPREFKDDFKRFYYHGGLPYDTALAKQFGSINFSQLIELRKQEILIPHKFFQDLDKLDGKVVRLYLAIKLLELIDEPATQEALSKLLGISDRALRPSLQDLCKSGHAYLSKGNARLKLPNTYHSHRGYSLSDGYMSFSYNDIRAYIMELFEGTSRGNGELKLYLFMRYKFYTGDVFMSQVKLAKNIGTARNTISVLVYRLQEKHFLKIRKVHMNSCFESCVYTLLR